LLVLGIEIMDGKDVKEENPFKSAESNTDDIVSGLDFKN